MDRERRTEPPRIQPYQHQHQATKHYQTLLPAVESSPIPRSLTTDPNRKLPPKRKLVLVACTRCRQKKEKCDGERPSCGRCITKAAECQYEVDDAKVSRTSALKRKCDSLQDENERLRELFGLLRQKSTHEANDILTRIRNSEDPLVVWRSIKDAELLLPWAPSASGSRDPRLEKIDAEALSESHVKVKAQPWTALAGDGIVSDLVSSFFAWDNTFRFAFIDKECFLEDMASGNPERAEYCSPFLVNAMCAFRCYTSARAKAFGAISGEDLTTRFTNEAKRLLAQERGRTSLPTAQGLVLLFMTTVFEGSDRVGMMYRLMSCEMLKQLNLEAKIAAIQSDPTMAKERKALSKAIWGHFIFENMVAYTYLQPSLTEPPRISSEWLEFAEDMGTDGVAESDRVWGKKASSATRPLPPMVMGLLGVATEVAKLMYETMKYNSSYGIMPGSADDLKVRRGLYAKASNMTDSLPERMRPQNNFTPQTCLLSVLLNEVAISILRPLRRDAIFNPQSDTVCDLFIHHCRAAIDLLDRYFSHWPLTGEYTYTVVCCTNNVALALVPVLDDSRTHDAFATACRIIDASARDFPISTYVLQGIQALAWAMRVRTPAVAAGFFEGGASSAFGEKELRDLPVALRIPYLDATGHVAPREGQAGDIAAQGAELGVLLARWNAMSIAE